MGLGTQTLAQMAFWIVVGITMGGAAIAVFARNILYGVLGLAFALANINKTYNKNNLVY